MKKESPADSMFDHLSKRMKGWAVVIAFILMIPLVARAPWTFSDFVFAAVALFSFAILYELATKNMNKALHKAAVGITVLFAIFLLIGWAAAGP